MKHRCGSPARGQRLFRSAVIVASLGTLILAGRPALATSVSDTTAPVVTVPADLIVEATSGAGRAVFYPATANDDVDGTLTPTCSPSSGSTFPLGTASDFPNGETTTVTCTATDSAGNVGSAQFSVTVRDTTGPVLSTPPDIAAEATGASGAQVTYAASAVDAVDGVLSPNCAVSSGATFPITTTMVSCAPADARGNSSSGSFNVTVVDATPPTLQVPSDQVLTATGPTGAAATFAVSATDLVDGDLATTCDHPSGSTFAVGITVVTCTAKDAAGNTGTGTFTITVNDLGAPVLTVPPDLTAEASGPDGAAVTYEASAIDVIDGPLTPTCTPSSGSTFVIGTTVVHCVAHDRSGNAGMGEFRITVADTVAPVIHTPADFSVEATGSRGARIDYVVTATDAVDGIVAASCTPASGSVFARGDTAVTCTASDTANNISAATFTVSVLDRVGPTLHLPDDMTAEATGPKGAVVRFDVTATDLVDGEVPASCRPASGTMFALGTTTVTCWADDTDGNHTTGSFTVDVADTTPPLLIMPTDRTAQATGPSGATVAFNVSAMDLVDGRRSVICGPASNSMFAIGTTTVTCGSADTAGNVAIGKLAIVVVDTTGPVLTLPDAGSINVEATGPTGAFVRFRVTATDAVSGPAPVLCRPPSGSLFPVGTTTVTCSSHDSPVPGVAAVRTLVLVPDTLPNTSTASFTVTVRPMVATPTGQSHSGHVDNAGARGLPSTGTSVLTSLLTAATLLAGGAMLMHAGRRRSTRG